MTETTREERDRWRVQGTFRAQEAINRLCKDADRLAQYERQCIPRTADMPEDAVTFHKDEAGECWLSDQHPIGPLLTGWDDLSPGEPGPLSRYIVNVE